MWILSYIFLVIHGWTVCHFHAHSYPIWNLYYFEVKIFFDKGLCMAMEMDNIELMVELQVFRHIHDQRAVHRQFTPDTQ